MKQTNVTIVKDFGEYSEVSISGLSGILLDNDDLPRVQEHKWYLDRSKAIDRDLYYFKASLELISKKPYRYKTITLHRFIMSQFNFDGIHVVDHIDQNSKNNRKSNLRVCTQHENMNNCRENVIKPDFLDYKVSYFPVILPVSTYKDIGKIRVTKLEYGEDTYIVQVPRIIGQSKRSKTGYPGISYDKQHKKWSVYTKEERYGFFDDIEDALKQAYLVYKIPYEIYKL